MPSLDPSRRDRLVAAAIELFTRYGVRRTSVEDIAAEAGIAKGSVYLELAGKDALFRAAAEQVASEIVAEARTAAAGDGVIAERIVDVLAAKFWRLYDLVHSRPHARELIDAKDATAADVFRVADDRYREIVEGVLAEGSWQVSAAELAGVLLRAAHGTGYGAARLTASAYRKRLALAVDLVLRGARRRR
jgi:AcrR family transcriptional regulator